MALAYVFVPLDFKPQHRAVIRCNTHHGTVERNRMRQQSFDLLAAVIAEVEVTLQPVDWTLVQPGVVQLTLWQTGIGVLSAFGTGLFPDHQRLGGGVALAMNFNHQIVPDAGWLTAQTTVFESSCCAVPALRA